MSNIDCDDIDYTGSICDEEIDITEDTTDDSLDLNSLTGLNMVNTGYNQMTLSYPSYSSGIYAVGGAGSGTGGYATAGGGAGVVWTGAAGYSTNTYADVGTYNSVRGRLSVDGDAEINGDLKIKGKNLMDILSGIEDRLAILHPNPEMEEKWEKLKVIGDEYRKTLAELQEKEKMWDILQK